jgi:integrase
VKTKVRLTDDFVAQLVPSPGKDEKTWWDADVPLFGCRVIRLKGGRIARSWTFGPYRIGRKQGRQIIGATSAIKAKDARATAARSYAMVKLSQDPQAEKVKARADQDDTFGAIVAIYLKRKAEELRPRSMVELRRHLEVHARPLHKIALADLTRRDVSTLIAKLADASGNVAANRTGSSIAAYLAWAQREGIVENNVGANHNKLHEASRERVLSDDELRSVWQATDSDTDYHAIVRLLMLTGMRRAEVGDLRWSEVDFERNIITLPEQRTKNARAFELPLSGTAAAILKTRPRDGERVFDGFSGFSSCKQALDARVKIEPWVLHDLRRSAATGMANIGVQPHIIEAALNHQSGAKAGVAGIYNRSSYSLEKCRALDRWAKHLMAIVEDRPAKVVVLRP